METERLILRRFTMDDLESIFYNCWGDFDVWKWTNYEPMYCVEDVIDAAGIFTEKWLGAYNKLNRYNWAIQLKESGEAIGRLFGRHPDDRVGQIELTYEIGQDWWNQGLMTEAVKAVLDFLFCQVGFNRVYAYHADGNPASGRVMQKCGMTCEGTLRQACLCNNGLFDEVVYSILADEYMASRRKEEIH